MPESLPPAPSWTLGQCATLACLAEVIAPKPGNVHRGADFENLSFGDFAASAVAIGPAFATAGERSVGQTVLDAIRATRRVVATNTNLGLVLLMAPLARVPREQPLVEGIAGVLAGLDAHDAALVYEAIRLAEPGGLGQVEAHDVAGLPPADLVAAMQLAQGRDLVARQYAAGFAEVLGVAAPRLAAGLARGWGLSASIVRVHVELLAEFPDSLIARKGGPALAEQASRLARQVVDAGQPGDEAYHAALADLDFWLRSDGHRRNPGTTADLVGAGLFALWRDGIIDAPLAW